MNGSITLQAILQAVHPTGSCGKKLKHKACWAKKKQKSDWGKGVGSAMLEKLIEFAESIGIEIINLEVRCDNSRAIQLYEKYGFRCLGTSPAFFKIGDKYIDFELMYLDLR